MVSGVDIMKPYKYINGFENLQNMYVLSDELDGSIPSDNLSNVALLILTDDEYDLIFRKEFIPVYQELNVGIGSTTYAPPEESEIPEEPEVIWEESKWTESGSSIGTWPSTTSLNFPANTESVGQIVMEYNVPSGIPDSEGVTIRVSGTYETAGFNQLDITILGTDGLTSLGTESVVFSEPTNWSVDIAISNSNGNIFQLKAFQNASWFDMTIDSLVIL